jgi:3-hydroxypropanoate dehydrogenase
MHQPLDATGLDLLFTKARTHWQGWTDAKVTEAQLRQIYDLMKMAPTSANSSPARFLFLMSNEAKEKLKPCLIPANVEKTMTSACTVIVGYDTEFYNLLPELFLLADVKGMFSGNATFAEETAFRNGTLQGAYFIMAARALGLDVGALSGFNKDQVNAAFFPDGKIKVNFILNLGVGDEKKVFPRQPRMPFEKFCKVI